jgi:hypothetical protein
MPWTTRIFNASKFHVVKNRNAVFGSQFCRCLLREQVCPGLGERQISAGRVLGQPAMRDCGGDRRAVSAGLPPASRNCVLIAATSSGQA